MKTIELPKVDLSRIGDPAGRQQETRKLIDACSGPGFILLTGLSSLGGAYDEDALFEATRWFYYDVSEEERLKCLAPKAYNAANKNVYRGYFPIKEGNLSHKRGFDIGQTIDSPLPEHRDNPLMEETPVLELPGREAEVDKFYKVIEHHRALTQRMADTILQLIAEAGGAEPNYFEPVFGEHQMVTYRLIHYPKRVKNIPREAYLPDGRVISTGAHQDSGYLTLLQTFGYPGLEVQLDGEWFAVPEQKGALVVNLGELMTDMSNGRFKATIHRVIDIGKDRMSLPLFYEPRFDADINFKLPAKLLPYHTPVANEPFPYATFLLNKLPIYVEYAHINDVIPDWMKKKYLDSAVTQNLQCWATRAGIKVDGRNHTTAVKGNRS